MNQEQNPKTESKLEPAVQERQVYTAPTLEWHAWKLVTTVLSIPGGG